MKKVLNPISTIKARIGIEPGGRVRKFFTEKCYKYMNKYVPTSGADDLRSNVSLTTNSITYKSSYAHYMYIGKVMGPNIPLTKKGVAEPIGWFSPKKKEKHYTGADITYHTAGTGPYWDKRMVSSDMNQVIKEVQNYLNRGA